MGIVLDAFTKKEFRELALVLNNVSKVNDLELLLEELLTSKELEDLTKRWALMKMLRSGMTQRDIANELKISLCKITRGAKILKNEKSMVNKIFKEKEKLK